MKRLGLEAAVIVLIFGCSVAHADDTSDITEGLPEHLIYLYTNPENSEHSLAQQQLYAGRRRWESGTTLRVCTFGGNETVATLIRDVATEWNQYSSLKLDFGPVPTGYDCLSSKSGFYQIRIGFNERGYWSVLGRDSDTRLDPLVPSMNLESFNRIYSEYKYSINDVGSKADSYHKAVIRHEFGHALGLLHEHQNPSLKCNDEIRWSGPNNVYDYFAAPPNSWSKSQVDRNLGYIGNTDPDYVSAEPDSKSIMMYSLPASIFKAGAAERCAVPVNYDISSKDKEIIALIYPKVPLLQSPLDIGKAPPADQGLPTFSPAYNNSDLIARSLVDLESDDTLTRRNARIRLAGLLKSDATDAQISNLISRINGASYRYQLGLSTALVNSKGEIKLSREDKQKLTALAKSTTDATLRNSLGSIQ